MSRFTYIIIHKHQSANLSSIGCFLHQGAKFQQLGIPRNHSTLLHCAPVIPVLPPEACTSATLHRATIIPVASAVSPRLKYPLLLLLEGHCAISAHDYTTFLQNHTKTIRNFHKARENARSQCPSISVKMKGTFHSEILNIRVSL